METTRPATWSAARTRAVVAAALAVVVLAIAGGVYWSRSTSGQEGVSELERVRALLAIGQPDAALQRIQQLGPPEELSSDLLLALAETQYYRADFAEALRLCELLSARPGADPRWHFWKANVHLSQWLASRAEEEYRQCVALGVYSEAAALQLAKIYGSQLRPDDAVPLVWELYQKGLPPSAELSMLVEQGDRVLSPNLLVQLLIIEYSGWDAGAMLDQLQMFHQGDPGDFEATLAYARGLAFVERYSDAWPLFGQLIAERPDHRPAQAGTLECALAAKNVDYCRQWLAQHPDDFAENARIWDLRGQVQSMLELFPESAVSFERAVAIDPYNHQARHRLGRCLARLGRRDEAKGHLEVAHLLNLSTRRLLQAAERMQDRVYPVDQCLIVAQSCHELGRPELANCWADIAQAMGGDAAVVNALRASIAEHPGGTLVAQTKDGK